MARFWQAVRGEWTKFRSARGTAYALLAAIGLTVLVSVLGAAGSNTNVNEGGTRYADTFHFVHRPLAGDGTVVARVAAQEDTGRGPRAGIMLKARAEPEAPYVAIGVTPGAGVRMQADFADGPASGTGGAPRWLRLTRSGTAVTGFESPDGVSWTLVGTVEVSGLPAVAEAGLFATSPGRHEVIRRATSSTEGQVFTASTATFDGVRVEPAGPAEPAGDAGWRSEDVGGPAVGVDGVTVAGGLARSGEVFTVTAAGDIRVLPPGGNDDVVMNALSGVLFGLIAIAVAGTLFVTTEYSRGLIRTTFAASPRRWRVLAAKAVVLGSAAFVAGLVASVAAFMLAQPIQHRNGYNPPAYPHPSLADGPVLRAVAGTAGLLAVLALFSLGVATIVRRAAGTIAVVIALVVVPPIVASFLPLGGSNWLQRLTPAAGFAIQQTRLRYDTPIGPWAGFAVLCGYAALALGVAFWLLRRRDA